MLKRVLSSSCHLHHNISRTLNSSSQIAFRSLTTKTSEEDQPTEKCDEKHAQEIEKLTAEITTWTEKYCTIEDKYKRSLAESDNMRKRLTKQIEDAKTFGIQSFCKDLLSVADALGLATESVPREEINDKNPHLKNLHDGLVMTNASLLQVFKRYGLEQVNPLNQKFDPNHHEALFQQEVPNVDANTVVVVSKIGYKLHERCIRPALVGVSKSPS